MYALLSFFPCYLSTLSMYLLLCEYLYNIPPALLFSFTCLAIFVLLEPEGLVGLWHAGN